MTKDEGLLKLATFEQLLRKSERQAEDETEKDVVHRSISIPMEVDYRIEQLKFKYDSSFKRVYMTITEFGYYRLIDDYGDKLKLIAEMRGTIITIKNRTLKRSIGRGKTRVDDLMDGEENSFAVATPIHIEIRNIAKHLNIFSSSMFRVSWYKALKVLEDAGEFEDFEKGMFDGSLELFEAHLFDIYDSMEIIKIGIEERRK